MNEAFYFCSEWTFCLLPHKRAAKENGCQKRQKHSRTFKHLSFLLCLIRYWKYHCVGTRRACKKPPGERKRDFFFFPNALQASQCIESLMKLLAITFKYAPQSCDNSTAAKQGLLGFSILISSANCSILTEFKCFHPNPFLPFWTALCLRKHWQKWRGLHLKNNLVTKKASHFWLFYPKIPPK